MPPLHPQRMKLTPYALLLFCLTALLAVGCSNRNNSPQYSDGKEITQLLDSLFTKLEKAYSEANSNSERLVEINEKIRRAIERIDSPKLLDDILSGYDTKKHDFSFILSPDTKVCVFSWYTHMENSGNRIKNIALYHSNDKMVPTSLYGTPVIYSEINQIETYDGETIYLLQGNDSINQNKFYRLNAYLLKNGYLEETPAFPNNESSIAINSLLDSSKMGTPSHFKIEMNGLRILFQDQLDTSNVENTLAFDGKKYVLENGHH